MLLLRAFRSRTDRVIALGRALLAVVAFLVIWLDPSQPVRHPDLAYILFYGYAVYSVAVALLTLTTLASDRLAFITHVGDIVAFSAAAYLTGGPTSPFYIFFTFALLAATLRWEWRGAVLTAALLVAVTAGLGLWSAAAQPQGDADVFRFVLRSAYLAVAGLLLAYLGLHQAQVRAMLTGLVAPPPVGQAGEGWPVRDALRLAAGVFVGHRCALVWAEDDEPWQHVAVLDSRTVEESREPPGRFEPVVDPALAESGFVSDAAHRRVLCFVHAGQGRFRRWRGRALNAGLSRHLNAGRVISVPVAIDGMSVRLFVLDDPPFTPDDVVIAEVTALRIAHLFEQHRHLERMRAATAAEERLRIARDLHDGVLQTLAGTALQLRAVAAAVDGDPTAVRGRLSEIERALSVEQRELRTLVASLRHDGAEAAAPEGRTLADQLASLARRLERQWEISIRCRVTPEDVRLDAGSAYEVCQIVGEAVVNARRHGTAKAVDVAVAAVGNRIRLVIVDDGSGFPFHGRWNDAERRDVTPGPWSLKGRIRERGGRLSIDSGTGGTRLDITLPLQSEAADHVG